MNQETPPAVSLPRLDWKQWVGFAALTLLLALVLVRVPVVINGTPENYYRSLLYENLRLGHPWGETLITTDGPLAAVQSPVYESGSIWMAVTWQIGGNLLLALLFVGAAYRLSWHRRWWALSLLGVTLARVPEIAPWLALVLTGWTLIRHQGATVRSIAILSGLLGFLAMFSLGHLLLGGAAIVLISITSLVPRATLAAVIGFVGTLLATWVALGQSLRALWLWLQRGLPVMWETSPFFRQPDALVPTQTWVGASSAALAITWVLFIRKTNRREEKAASMFLVVAAVLAWKASALQPFGILGVFFSTVIVSAFLLSYSGRNPAAPVILATVAFGGLVQWQPLILTDGIGHFNRELMIGIRAVAALPDQRAALRTQVKQLKAEPSLPRIKAAIGPATVDLIGGQSTEAIISTLNLRTRPAPLIALVRSSTIAGLNQQTLSGHDAPEFIIQRLQPSNDILPTLEDSTLQLELYHRYDFVLEEDGLMLWKHKKDFAESEQPVLVKSGELSLGDKLDLPAITADTGYWLELEIHPNFMGSIWSCFDELVQPGLLVRDENGQELHYALPASLASRGFLVAPFVRGEPDILRLQTGTELPRITSLSVATPVTGAWLWNKRVSYRLYSIRGLNLRGDRLDPDVFKRFRLFNRIPIGLGYYSPIKVLPFSEDAFIAFAHPDSVVEFAVTKQDRLVRASFGIIENAYRGKNHTDGVDFSVEFISSDGVKQVLYHRLLNPLVILEDRGLQKLDVALPPGQPGRLLMRTYNPPERGRAFDWAYWGGITLE